MTIDGEVRSTWDMTIYTDQVLKHNQPVITLAHRDTQCASGKGWEVLGTSIRNQKIHGALKVAIISIVIGALESILKRSKAWFGKLSVSDFLGSVQLSAILRTAQLLPKVLCLQATESCWETTLPSGKLDNWREPNDDDDDDDDNDNDDTNTTNNNNTDTITITNNTNNNIVKKFSKTFYNTLF